MELIGLLLTIFWIMAIVDVARREFPTPATKIVWLLVVIFTHALGALIYYIFGRPQGRLIQY